MGCRSGPAYTLDGYTDANGNLSFSLRYNTSADVTYTVSANGYYTQSGNFSISGANIVDENVWYTKKVALVQEQSTSYSPPPGQGISAGLNDPQLQAVGSDFASAIQGAGLIGSIELTIIIVVVAIAIILFTIAMVIL